MYSSSSEMGHRPAPVLPPRLTDDEAVARAVLLNDGQLPDDDPRLASVDRLLWGAARLATAVIPEAWLIEWPDGALGFAILAPESAIAERLVSAYASARMSLECRAMELVGPGGSLSH